MAFTARTETYFDAATLTTPFDATVDKPTGTIEDDILFALVVFASTATIDSDPSGWAKLGEYLDNFDKYVLYYKVAGASEPSSYTWSFSDSASARIVCSCYTSGDFDTVDSIDVVSNTAYRTSGTTVRAASMTVSIVSSPLVFWAASRATSRTYTKPSVPTTDWVEDDDAGNTSSDWYIEVCSMIWSGSGATGDMDATCSVTSTTKHAFAVALNPAPAAGQPTMRRWGGSILPIGAQRIGKGW